MQDPPSEDPDGTGSAVDRTDRPTARSRRLATTLALPFWNRRERRLRALWRVLGAFLLALVGSQLLPSTALRGADLPPSLFGLAANVLSTAVVLAVAVLWARSVDRRPVSAYGLDLSPAWGRDFLWGVLVALVGWGLALSVDLAAGWAHVSAVVSPGSTADSLPFALAFAAFAGQFLLVGLWEELLFRGIVLRNAAEGFESRWLSPRSAVFAGLVCSSLLFAVVHAGQASSTLALGFWALMGLLLGGAYVLTDSLALPIGLHFATNLAVNNVFGLSSVRPAASELATLIRPEFTGPTYLVGISGVVNTGAALAIVALTVGYVAVRYGSLTPRLSPER